MRKILITGAKGGIGSAISKALKEHELTLLGRYDFFPQDNFDWCIFAHGMLAEESLMDTFITNTTMPIELTQLLIKQINQGGGFIYISSTAAITANSKFPIYSASKAALNCYARAMAKAHPELKFYAICPGPTDTKMWRSLGLKGNAQAPIEVAKAVTRCIDGEYMSGDIIVVRDGIRTVCL